MILGRKGRRSERAFGEKGGGRIRTGRKDPREEKGEDLGGKGGKDLNRGKRSWGGKGRSRGGKGLRGERGKSKKISTRKRGKNALGGKGGKGSQQERWQKILGEEKGEDLKGKRT